MKFLPWKIIHATVFGLSLMAVAASAVAAAAGPAGWYTAELERLTAGTGRWIADNAEYRSDDEPFDAYGLVWRKAAGGTAATGRLFGVRDGEETADFWQFRIYWDAAAGGAVIEQFSGNGAFGRGPLMGFGEATLSDQTFTAPDGSQRREMHHAWFERDVHVTRSFRWQDGAWVPQRTYRWRQPAGDEDGT